MTIKITPEAVKERIAALEAAGETSLKEQFYLEALRLLVAAPDGEQLAIENFRSAMEGIGHIRRTLEETFGGLHGTHVEPDVLAECKAICDAIYAAYGRAQSARAAEYETKDEWRRLALQFDGHRMQAICFLKQILKELPASEFSSAREFLKAGPLPGEEVLRNRIAEIAALSQPAPVVPDDVLKALQKVARIRLDMDGFDGDRRGIADCLCDAEEALIEVVNRRAAMLQAAPVCTCPSGDGSLRWPCPVHPGNSPVVPDGIERVASMAEYLGNFSAAAIIRQLAANQTQNAQQNIPEIIPDSCTWTFSNYDDHWSGTCGVEWIFPDGGPEENGVKFCPKCGKSVAVSATEGTEE